MSIYLDDASIVQISCVRANDSVARLHIIILHDCFGTEFQAREDVYRGGRDRVRERVDGGRRGWAQDRVERTSVVGGA